MSKILLVEDETSVLGLYKRLFEKRGHQVSIAIDGQEALDKLFAGKETYDLILLDILLPKVSGMEVLKKVKSEDSRFKDTPVYMLTNLGEDSVIEESKRYGADGYLVKAHHLPHELVKTLEDVLKNDTNKKATNQKPAAESNKD